MTKELFFTDLVLTNKDELDTKVMGNLEGNNRNVTEFMILIKGKQEVNRTNSPWTSKGQISTVSEK